MSRVALVGENSIPFVGQLINIWNVGHCAVLINPKMPKDIALKMMRDAEVISCYIERGIWGIVEEKVVEEITCIPYDGNIVTDFLPQELYDKFIPQYTQDEAVVIYSSGTTGTSRGIILSHYAINKNADAIASYMQLSERDVLYVVKPLTHSSSLTGELLVALKKKNKIVIGSSVRLPRVILKNIKKFEVTHLFLNPFLAFMLSKEQQRTKYEIESLKTIYISGAVLNQETYEEVHRVFYQQSIYNVYGLSETAPRIAAQCNDCCKNNSVGKPIEGVKVAIINEEGENSKRFEYGIVHVKSPSLFKGYITGETKHPPLRAHWFNTGDVGYTDDDGELHIVGRIDDVINIGAQKIYPSDVEHTICKYTHVKECVVTSITVEGKELLGCLYVADNYIGIRERKILSKKLLQHEIPSLFVRAKLVPRTNAGKIDMGEVKRNITKYARNNRKMDL